MLFTKQPILGSMGEKVLIMQWSDPVTISTLKKRYKRFLADVLIDDELHVAHVPNTGSMTSCWDVDWQCLISESSNPNRKLKFTLEMTHNGLSWIGVNTANANKLVKEWLTDGKLEAFLDYKKIVPEKKVGASRIDFFLEEHPVHANCFIEVKNVTLKLDNKAQFPDAVSERGQKHLIELTQLKNEGHRCAMVYVVQREDVNLFTPAESIDPVYAKLLREAVSSGVEVYVYQCKLDETGIHYYRELPYSL